MLFHSVSSPKGNSLPHTLNFGGGDLFPGGVEVPKPAAAVLLLFVLVP